jgi:hypothetical protein
MNPKNILCLALVLCGGLLLTGCHGLGTQRFTAFAPAQSSQLETSSRVVLDVTSHAETARPDYNLNENLSMLAPMPRYWKYDVTLQVERVVKGEFGGGTVQLHWLREPTIEQYGTLGMSPAMMIGFTNGTRLRIGFNGRSGKKLRDLKIMVQP